MNRIFTFFIVLVFISCSTITNDAGWKHMQEPIFEGKIYKQHRNVRFIITSDIEPGKREMLITKCDAYIEDNLRIIKESEFVDSLDIILVQDLDEMYKYTRERVAGMISLIGDNENRNMIFCLYRGKESPLKHELMHMIAMCKWGTPEGGLPLQWLNEGLATYADPEAECDGYPFEEKYAAFLHSDKLIDSDSLINNFIPSKISYNQTAYMVEYMIENYGVGKIKLLWQSGMDKFEEVFGLTFEELTIQINDELSQKHPNPIEFNWAKFEEGCY